MKITDKIEITNEDNMTLMSRYEDKYFDLAIVDPPYGIGIANKSFRSKHEKKSWDEESPKKKYFDELFRVSKNQIICGGNYFDLPKYRCPIAWDKMQPFPNFSSIELAWTSFNKPADIIKIDNRYSGKIHPTQKPVALYKWILDKYAKEGDKILDTHLGSMSIAIACHDYGFELTGCELDKEYFDKGVQRVKNHVSQLKLF